ncbi:MAG: nucleotidyltransferase family protein [Flavobacteriaceae bacterium]|jgi:NDP-sugar pyrophosphorylase family protein|nr:nucleotidyltransferase family protein [Flavobacteriaceae bacterium]
MKAMIFAAGLGTRLKPFTETHPKALAQVNGKTLLERNILYLKSFGFEEMVINIHHFGGQILDFLAKNNNFGCKISISDESKEVLETGGGLLKAQNLLGNEPFLVINVDVLTHLDLRLFIRFHLKNNPLVSLAVSDRQSSRKLFFNKEKQLVGWKNFNTEETIFMDSYSENQAVPLAFSGIHIVNPEIFEKISFQGKFSIMKVYMELMKTEKILGFEHKAHLVDVGKPEAILEAKKYFV